MRITRDRLIKFAETAVAQRVRQDRRLICVYLTGSLLLDEPLLGGTTDIDLVFVHDSEPEEPREVIRITDEIHLDIAHVSQSLFHQPRHLRVDPWLGSYLCYNPIQLHDTQHWFEFTQASVCAQFNVPEFVFRRARPLAENARQIWMEMTVGAFNPGPEKVLSYLKILENAANAIACLSGPPMTERRFLLQYFQRTLAVERPGLSHGLADLISSDEEMNGRRQEWSVELLEALKAACSREDCPPRLQSCRHAYYERAIDVLWDENPAAALWLLLNVWTRAVHALPEDHPQRQPWNTALQQLNLDDDSLSARLDSVDAYLDTVEETLDMWASRNGVSLE